MKVYIISEGGQDIGFGHITRCIALYQGFEEKGTVPEFIINGDNSVKDLLSERKRIFFNWLKEEDRLFNTIKKASVVIIDSYLAGPRFYNKIAKKIALPVYIDDFKRLDYPRGIVINANLYAGELNYPEKETTTCLLGSRYALLRKEFWKVPAKKIRKRIESIMVTFGGNDSKNMTLNLLRFLKEKFPGLKKNVVIARAFKNNEALKKEADGQTALIYNPDIEEMKNLMYESDLAISAGGQTLYELARVGVPTIAITVAGNQDNNITAWKKAGFIEHAGWWNDSALYGNIFRYIKKFNNYAKRSLSAKTARSLVSGKGAQLAVDAIVRGVREGIK